MLETEPPREAPFPAKADEVAAFVDAGVAAGVALSSVRVSRLMASLRAGRTATMAREPDGLAGRLFLELREAVEDAIA